MTLASVADRLITDFGRAGVLIGYGPDVEGPYGMEKGPEARAGVQVAFGKQREMWRVSGAGEMDMRIAYINNALEPDVGNVLEVDGDKWYVVGVKKLGTFKVAWRLEVRRS